MFSTTTTNSPFPPTTPASAFPPSSSLFSPFLPGQQSSLNATTHAASAGTSPPKQATHQRSIFLPPEPSSALLQQQNHGLFSTGLSSTSMGAYDLLGSSTFGAQSSLYGAHSAPSAATNPSQDTLMDLPPAESILDQPSLMAGGALMASPGRLSARATPASTQQQQQQRPTSRSSVSLTPIGYSSNASPMAISPAPAQFQAQSQLPKTPGKSVHVTVFGFPPGTGGSIIDFFGQFGTITNYIYDPSTNFVHITYANEFSAERALRRNGQFLDTGVMVGVVRTPAEVVAQTTAGASNITAASGVAALTPSSRRSLFAPSPPQENITSTTSSLGTTTVEPTKRRAIPITPANVPKRTSLSGLPSASEQSSQLPPLPTSHPAHEDNNPFLIPGVDKPGKLLMRQPLTSVSPQNQTRSSAMNSLEKESRTNTFMRPMVVKPPSEEDGGVKQGSVWSSIGTMLFGW